MDLLFSAGRRDLKRRQCHERGGNYQIDLIDPWMAYIGLDKFHEREKDKASRKMLIETVIRHEASYRGLKGGGYGYLGKRLNMIDWV